MIFPCLPGISCCTRQKLPTSPFLIRRPHLCSTDPLIAIFVLLTVCFFFFFGRECPRYRRKWYSRPAKQSACVSACGGSVLVGTHSSQAVPSWYFSDHSGIRSYRRRRDHDQRPLREGGGREADIFSICDRLLCIYFQRLSADNDEISDRRCTRTNAPTFTSVRS
jgi:hypothetical protein